MPNFLWNFSLKAKHYFKEGMRKLQYILSGSYFIYLVRFTRMPRKSFAWKSVFQFVFGKILPIVNRSKLLKHFAKYSHFENDLCENVFQNYFFRSLAQVKEVFRCGSIFFYVLQLSQKKTSFRILKTWKNSPGLVKTRQLSSGERSGPRRRANPPCLPLFPCVVQIYVDLKNLGGVGLSIDLQSTWEQSWVYDSYAEY